MRCLPLIREDIALFAKRKWLTSNLYYCFMETHVKLLGKEDLAEFIHLINVFEEVFEMKNFQLPPAGHLQQLLSRDDFAVIVATQGNEVIGGLTVYTWQQYYAVKPLAYIYDLAVLTRCQRQGIGRLLIAFTLDHYRKSGYEEVFVQADRIDDYALDFYRKTNPTAEEDVAHFYYRLDNWKANNVR